MNRLGPPCPAGPARPTGADLYPGSEDEVRMDGVRIGLVLRVRQEIAAGVYDTPEKWERALDRLLDRLQWE